MISTQDNAYYIETVTEQGGAEGDWIQENGTTLSYAPKEIVIDSITDATHFDTYTPCATDDEVLLVNSDDTFSESSLTNVSESGDANTLDSATKGSNVTLSNGDLTYNGDSAAGWDNDNVFSSDAVSAGGLLQLELKFDTECDTQVDIGLCTSTAEASTEIATQATTVLSIYINGSAHKKQIDGVDAGDYGTEAFPLDINSVYGITYHTETGDIRFYVNGTDQGLGHTVDANTELFLGFGSAGSDDDITVNFGATSFSHPVSGAKGFNNKKYTATIDSTPDLDKCFFNNKVDVSITVEDTEARCITKANEYLTIESSTQTSMSVTEAVKEDERIVVNGISALVGTVTGTAPYVVDITNHGLGGGEVAERAYKIGYEALTKVSSTTTEFVGANAISGLMETGDIISLDDIEVVTTNVVETEENDYDGANNSSTTDAVPAMTASDAPNGEASASSIYDAAYAAFVGFNNNSSGGDALDSWISVNGTNPATTPQWLNYEFLSGKIINKVTIAAPKSGSYYDAAPEDFLIQGSNDGSAYTTISTVTGETNWADGEKRTFTFTNSTTYVNYRVYITKSWNSTDYTGISELEFIEHDNTFYEYTATFNAVSSSPTTGVIPSRDTQLTVESTTFDGTDFENTYSDLSIVGRAIQRKITAEASDTTVTEPLVTQLNKEA